MIVEAASEILAFFQGHGSLPLIESDLAKPLKAPAVLVILPALPGSSLASVHCACLEGSCAVAMPCVSTRTCGMSGFFALRAGDQSASSTPIPGVRLSCI